MSRHAILAHSVAIVAVCLGASCSAPHDIGRNRSSTISGAKEPPLPLVKWDDLPIELKKASSPPYSGHFILRVARRFTRFGFGGVKAIWRSAERRPSGDPSTFLACHFAVSALQGKAYAEQRRKCLIQAGRNRADLIDTTRPGGTMNWIVAKIKGIMLVSGVLTCTMFYAAIAPQAALRSTFRNNAGGPADQAPAIVA